MNAYEKLFKRSLLKEEFSPRSQPQQNFNNGPVMDQNTQDTDIGSDTDAWARNNPEIADSEELSTQFSTQGLDKAEIEKYTEIIAKWGEGINQAIDQLAQIIKFAASEKLNGAPGSEQLSALIKDAPRLKKDLSAFKSQVEDLSETVKIAINDDAIERRNKIDSLG